MQTQISIKTALISVSNKTGIVEFAKELTRCRIKILATGGTASLLKKHNISITEISEYTGFPEIMAGRLKTLHPKIHGGLLGRRDQDQAVMLEHGIDAIDLVVVNLYPFAETIAAADCTLAQAIEQIDVGGPTMLRAAAKNYSAVTVITDPNDYDVVLQEIQHKQSTSLELRYQLAQKVFAITANYDQQIATYLAQSTTNSDLFPENFAPQYKLSQKLRYGENSHQQAALYTGLTPAPGTLAHAEFLQGKELSYNNLIDADCALCCVQELDPNVSACVIVKHATPCGVAEADTLLAAYTKAYACDPESAFGGIIACNKPLDKITAETLSRQQFVEVIIAPEFHPEAVLVLKQKANVRLLAYGALASRQPTLTLRSISGGLLAQEYDSAEISAAELTIVTERKPSAAELQDLLFAWRVVKFTKSNAIVYAKNRSTLGIGTGQTSRVFAAKIAALRAEMAGFSLNQAVLASDAFFPFADSIELASKEGISAIIQPGGSKRDNEVIAAANAANIAMVFTGVRHFRH